MKWELKKNNLYFIYTWSQCVKEMKSEWKRNEIINHIYNNLSHSLLHSSFHLKFKLPSHPSPLFTLHSVGVFSFAFRFFFRFFSLSCNLLLVALQCNLSFLFQLLICLDFWCAGCRWLWVRIWKSCGCCGGGFDAVTLGASTVGTGGDFVCLGALGRRCSAVGYSLWRLMWWRCHKLMSLEGGKIKTKENDRTIIYDTYQFNS